MIILPQPLYPIILHNPPQPKISLWIYTIKSTLYVIVVAKDSRKVTKYLYSWAGDFFIDDITLLCRCREGGGLQTGWFWFVRDTDVTLQCMFMLYAV